MSLKPPSSFDLTQRSAGVLLHPSSLATPYGIGDLGPAAEKFVDFLKSAGQRWWQMLPVGPTGEGHSPYSAFSAFAGNALLLSPDIFCDEKLLRPEELKELPGPSDNRVDYAAALTFKTQLFRKAFARFSESREYQAFLEREADWIGDYALFAALRDAYGGKSWTSWDSGLRRREKQAVKDAQTRLSEQIRYHLFLQFSFDRQWSRLRTYAHQQGVGLIGDTPIFVSHESADVWAHPDLFHLDRKGNPTVVSGVPPDLFSKTGQRWGNPHYHWKRLEQTGFAWWIARFRKLFNYFDVVRLDHFIGFYHAWEIPAREKTAVRGRFVRTPGERFFRRVLKELPSAVFIAEDLGAVVPGVTRLRDQFKFPGMNVLQFAFNGDPQFSTALPYQFKPDSVVYTGTHDNNTTLGWFRSEASAQERKNIAAYLNKPRPQIPWDLIVMAYASIARTAIIPMQDVLGLDERARMNLPGTAHGNWGWRMKSNAITPTLIKRLKSACSIYGR